MKIKKDDNVLITAGKDKGKTGLVTSVLTAKKQLVVAGVNLKTKYKKKTVSEAGSMTKIEGGIDASNVALICPACSKATRVGYAKEEGKPKQRVCKKCNALIDKK